MVTQPLSFDAILPLFFATDKGLFCLSDVRAKIAPTDQGLMSWQLLKSCRESGVIASHVLLSRHSKTLHHHTNIPIKIVRVENG